MVSQNIRLSQSLTLEVHIPQGGVSQEEPGETAPQHFIEGVLESIRGSLVSVCSDECLCQAMYLQSSALEQECSSGFNECSEHPCHLGRYNDHHCQLQYVRKQSLLPSKQK